MIVLNVTFFIHCLLEVTGEWAGSVGDDCLREGTSNFFPFVYLTVNIFIFIFDVKPKCGNLF